VLELRKTSQGDANCRSKNKKREGGFTMPDRAFWYESVDTGTKYGRMGRLMKTTRSAIEDCLGVKPGETVTIVSDTEVSPLVYHGLAAAVLGVGAIPTIVIMEPLPHSSAEPPPAVAAAMRESDAFINACSRTITHTQARYEANLKFKKRYLLMPGVTEDMLMNGSSTADLKKVKKIASKVFDALNGSKEVHVSSDYGTDVTFSSKDRRPKQLLEAHEPATMAVFPGGEMNICPVEDTANGTIVIDRFLLDIGLLSEPVTWKVKNGRVYEITGGREADQLKEYLEKHGDENSLCIGEFSIGLNYEARSVGNNIEDKQVYGSVHIAIGSGVTNHPYYTAKYHSATHIDGLMLKPTVLVDGKVLVNKGEIVGAPRPSTKD
jgi:leucyl aminopeptidase (aminopeptidase T)